MSKETDSLNGYAPRYKVGSKVIVDGYGNGIIKLIEGNKYHIASDEEYEFPYRVFMTSEFKPR